MSKFDNKPKDIKISVIIPTWHGEAEEAVDSVLKQKWKADEIELVAGVSPNGRARNVGVAATSAPYLVFLDDDAILGDEMALANLINPLINDPSIHITGASKLIPPDSPPFQRWVARELPRIEHPVVKEPIVTSPDPPNFYCEVTTTCCAMRRSDFDKIKGFSETLVRGVDTEFFVRCSRAGYKIVLIPDTWTWHPAPANLMKLCRKHFLYGLGHGQELRLDPSRRRGVQRQPLFYILFRTAVFLPNIFLPYSFASPEWKIGFKPLKALTSYIGAWGTTIGMMRRSKNEAETQTSFPK